MNKNQIFYKQTGAGAIIDVDPKKRYIKAYGSMFDNIDSDGEYIKRGAWDKTIAENGPNGKNRLKLVRNHDMNYNVGKFDELYTDDKGLVFGIEISERKQEIDYIKAMLILMEEGDLDEFSIGARLINGYQDESRKAFAITEAALYHISDVTLAANEQAVLIDLKHMDMNELTRIVTQMEGAEKLLRKGNLTDETCKQIEFQIMSWKSLLSSQVPESPHLPMDWLVDSLKNHNNDLKEILK